jgi:hypothetical protein
MFAWKHNAQTRSNIRSLIRNPSGSPSGTNIRIRLGLVLGYGMAGYGHGLSASALRSESNDDRAEENIRCRNGMPTMHLCSKLGVEAGCSCNGLVSAVRIFFYPRPICPIC